MQRYIYLLRLSLLSFLLCLALFVSVFAEEQRGKGFLTFVNDYFDSNLENEIEQVPDPTVSVLENDAPMLYMITPEGIESGIITLWMNSKNDYKGGQFVWCNETLSGSSINSIVTQRMTYTDLPDTATTYTDTIQLSSNNDIVICEAGKIFSMSLSNIAFYWDYPDNGTTNHLRLVDSEYLDISVYYKRGDGQKVLASFDELIFSSTSDERYMYFSMTTNEPLKFDIYGIDIVIQYDVTQAFGMPVQAALNRFSRYLYPSHTVGYYNTELIFREIEQTNGLLNGIIGWLQGIWEGITSLPGKVVSGIGDLLESLFVPSSDSLNEWNNKFDVFFSDHFGFVYQGASIIVDVFEVVISSLGNVQDTITFPLFEYDFGDGAVFSFGGYEVDVVPEGFEGLVQTLKLVINIVITLAFLNVSLKYFDKFLNR